MTTYGLMNLWTWDLVNLKTYGLAIYGNLWGLMASSGLINLQTWHLMSL